MPGETIDGHQTNLLVGQTEGQPPVRLYFDAQTGLLVRLIRYTRDAARPVADARLIHDYRDADGAKIPYSGRSRGRVTVTISVDSSSKTSWWTTRSSRRRRNRHSRASVGSARSQEGASRF